MNFNFFLFDWTWNEPTASPGKCFLRLLYDWMCFCTQSSQLLLAIRKKYRFKRHVPLASFCSPSGYVHLLYTVCICIGINGLHLKAVTMAQWLHLSFYVEFMVLQLCVAFDQRDQTTPGSVDVACSVARLGMVGHIFWCWFLCWTLSPLIFTAALYVGICLVSGDCRIGNQWGNRFWHNYRNDITVWVVYMRIL